MGNSTTVLKVEMDANVDLLRRYHLERKKVARRKRRGRQRGVAVACNVQQWCGAIHRRKCGLDFEYYGAGIYLAPDCELSNRRCKVRDTACFWYASKSETQSMLLVRVACGKVLERPPLHDSPEHHSLVQQLASQQLAPGHLKKLQQDKTRELLRMPTNRSCPDCYHNSALR
jgi:hypothetical protein